MQQSAAYLQSHGFAHADSLTAAYARINNQLYAQTRLLAFMDCFYILGLVTLIAAPVALLVKNTRPGKDTPAH